VIHPAAGLDFGEVEEGFGEGVRVEGARSEALEVRRDGRLSAGDASDETDGDGRGVEQGR
jgi:hypothetical protein